jgi:hypothetical protein
VRLGHLPLAGSALLLGACTHFHLDRNAPGMVVLARPPENLAKEGVEPPGDPGEALLAVTAGAYLAGGARLEAWDLEGGWATGAELSAHFGCEPRSHDDTDLFVYPRDAHGVNLGWTFAEDAGGGVGPVYLEYQRTEVLTGGAIGLAWDPDDGVLGPQATLNTGPLMLRAAYLHDRGTEVMLGIVLKGAAVWVWSR